MTGPDRLDADELAAYFTLMEVGSLLQHAVAQQLRADGDLSWVQFQLLARLHDAPGGQQRMTDLADDLVYSRSGITYQAGLLERAELISRTPSVDDDRSITVTITETGRTLLARVMPGHVEVTRRVLLAPLSRRDLGALNRLLSRIRDQLRTAPPRSAATRPPARATPRHDVPTAGQ